MAVDDETAGRDVTVSLFESPPQTNGRDSPWRELAGEACVTQSGVARTT
jgi:hypothetical protein